MNMLIRIKIFVLCTDGFRCDVVSSIELNVELSCMRHFTLLQNDINTQLNYYNFKFKLFSISNQLFINLVMSCSSYEYLFEMPAHSDPLEMLRGYGSSFAYVLVFIFVTCAHSIYRVHDYYTSIA